MSAAHRTAVDFGWAVDHGEFAVVTGEADPLVRLILDHCGFDRRVDELGAWAVELGADDRDQQIAAAAVAVDLLGMAGYRVGNWHDPGQRTAAVARHYQWLRSEDPFPDAAETARAAAADARIRLSNRELPPHVRATTEEVASGLLLVEARRTLGDSEWLLATPRDEPDHCLRLVHGLNDAYLGITDDYARWYAGGARRDFRIDILRETRPPRSARARAAAHVTTPVQLPPRLADRAVHQAVVARRVRRR
ncbi:hypothetical protein ACFC26_14975 [Kitasatospora purpeofusca]|uniref:hypothetical protein n=1 Tax=Kitasatospora purpeofusca TaxID=67352 RepID=UPI0035D9262B